MTYGCAGFDASLIASDAPRDASVRSVLIFCVCRGLTRTTSLQMHHALRSFEKTALLRMESLGDDHLLYAGALISVAGALQRLGRTGQALER